MENSRLVIERQNKELKSKLQELEASQRTKTKTTIAQMEAKIVQLEETVDHETKERLSATKSVRKMDKKVKEMQNQIEDERRTADQYKEQVEKINNRVKALKRQLDEAEEECSREKGIRRKVQRELEDTLETNEALTREIGNLKNKIRYLFDWFRHRSQIVSLDARVLPEAPPGAT